MAGHLIRIGVAHHVCQVVETFLGKLRRRTRKVLLQHRGTKETGRSHIEQSIISKVHWLGRSGGCGKFSIARQSKVECVGPPLMNMKERFGLI